jgi:dephospho-CoA kinase
MRVIGLTGSIGMGKSTAARMIKRCGIRVHDADAAVHRLLSRGGAAVAAVERAFPESVRDGVVDRTMLGAIVFNDKTARRQLEEIVHPLVRRASAAFLRAAARRRDRVVVLDIPLLYESGTARGFDAVIVVSAPAWLQHARVMRRAGMTEAKLAGILASQMPDSEKRRHADAVVTSAQGMATTRRELRRALRRLIGRPARAWRPGRVRD